MRAANEASRQDRADDWMVPSVEAVEYGRKVIGRLIDKYRGWEQKAKAAGDEEQEIGWRRIANSLVRDLYGYDDGGCVITAFDKRWLDPEFRRVMEEVRRRG